jgi:hypothetical protein
MVKVLGETPSIQGKKEKVQSTFYFFPWINYNIGGTTCVTL